MYCPNCGARNDDTAQFCIQCGKPLKATSSPREGTGPGTASSPGVVVPSFIREKEVNVTFAILVLVLGLVGIVLALIPFGIIVTALLGFASGVLQAILVFQWADVLNTNVQNTRAFLSLAMKPSPEQAQDFQTMDLELSNLRVDMTMFWIYLACYVLFTIFFSSRPGSHYSSSRSASFSCRSASFS